MRAGGEQGGVPVNFFLSVLRESEGGLPMSTGTPMREGGMPMMTREE